MRKPETTQRNVSEAVKKGRTPSGQKFIDLMNKFNSLYPQSGISARDQIDYCWAVVDEEFDPYPKTDIGFLEAMLKKMEV